MAHTRQNLPYCYIVLDYELVRFSLKYLLYRDYAEIITLAASCNADKALR